jgi:hypothetical protein
MAGLAATISLNPESNMDSEFRDLVQWTADFKSLPVPSDYATGHNCVAAKLDFPASLHRGITFDATTGSWLIAAGTVIDTHHAASDGHLLDLLRDYLIHGDPVFARCDGMFAMLIYNGMIRSLVVVSDPFGYFSIFYGRRGHRWFVSTSALAVAKAVRSEPSGLGVSCFLRTGKVFGEMTLWRKVKRVPPAAVLNLPADSPQGCTYWTLGVDESITRLSFEEALEASAETLAQVLQRNLKREGKVWTDLTGGFDTRLLAMSLARAGIPFKANVVGSPTHPDVSTARHIADQMGWEYQHFRPPPAWPQECLQYLEDAMGMGDAHLDVLSLARPLWASRQRAAQYPLLLNGLGGEMWRGPIWGMEKGSLGKSTEVHYGRLIWSFIHPIPNSIFVADPLDQVRNEVVGQFERVGERYADFPNTVKLDCVWTYRETGHVGAWGSFLSSMLRSLPPLFSKDVVSFVVSLDYRWKLDNRMVRYLFERYNPALADIDVAGRGPAAPMRLTNFHRYIPAKLGYYRVGAWKLLEIAFGISLRSAQNHVGYSKQEWRQEILKWADAKRLFMPSEMRSARLYDPDRLASLLQEAAGERFRYSEFLGRIMTVEMALRAVDSALV